LGAGSAFAGLPGFAGVAGGIGGAAGAATATVPLRISIAPFSQFITSRGPFVPRERHRAGMLFGRAFEESLAALFRREDSAAVLFEQWDAGKNMGLTYSGNDTWDRMCS
jgi:hypothetical protein